MNVEHNYHQQLLDVAVQAEHAYPADRFKGRGIVICGGGLRYFTCAWVCINMLRKLGCALPVQLWHLGAKEMTDEMRLLLKPLGVECVDGLEVRKRHPARILNGWEIKPYAIIHSPFQEVLSLDADNVPVVNPEFLFDTPQFKETGAIFWPDYGRLAKDRSIWDICGIAYRDEPEFESGQIVVDKARCWQALRVTMHLNEHSDFYYRHIHGDKETFHMGFRKVNKAYSMPAKGIHALDATMCQHDFDGNRIFQHRNLAKWSLFGANRRISGFLYEDECLGFLDSLGKVWKGLPSGAKRFNPSTKSQSELKAGEMLAKQRYEYHRVGHDRRPMSFCADGTVGTGKGGCEIFWDVAEASGAMILEISAEQDATCRLTYDGTGAWKGQWLRFEKMPVELTPLSP